MMIMIMMMMIWTFYKSTGQVPVSVLAIIKKPFSTQLLQLCLIHFKEPSSCSCVISNQTNPCLRHYLLIATL